MNSLILMKESLHHMIWGVEIPWLNNETNLKNETLLTLKFTISDNLDYINRMIPYIIAMIKIQDPMIGSKIW